MIWRTFLASGPRRIFTAAPFRRSSAHGNSRAKIRPSPALSPTLPAGKRTPPRCWPAENTPAECAPICRCRCSLHVLRNAAQRPARPAPLVHDFAVVRRQRPRHFHRLFAARPLQPPQPERVIALLDHGASAARQLRHAFRHAVALQIRRRSAQDALVVRQLARDQIRGDIVADADIQIEPFADQIHQPTDTSSRSSSCGYPAPAPTAPGPRSAGRSRSC